MPGSGTIVKSTGGCGKILIDIDELRGWESLIRIEPCAWRRSQISYACLRKSGNVVRRLMPRRQVLGVTGSGESR